MCGSFANVKRQLRAVVMQKLSGHQGLLDQFVADDIRDSLVQVNLVTCQTSARRRYAFDSSKTRQCHHTFLL